MSRFLIFGAVAWDRLVRLSGPLMSGGRLSGVVEPDPHGGIAGGRLGGGGANAAAALLSAGHEAAIYAPVPEDAVGDDMIAALKLMTVDMRFIRRVEGSKGATLILIEPNGERVVLGLQPHNEDAHTLWKRARDLLVPPSLNAMQSYDPRGVYLRAPLPGYEATARLEGAVVVAHWPFGRAQDTAEADVLIGSRDDLGANATPQFAFNAARQIAGERLKWAIVTAGGDGGVIYGPEGYEQSFLAAPVEQVDTTGAGDTFAAGVLEALCAGADIAEAARHGAAWGATTAGLIGAAERRPPGFYTPWGG